MAFVERQVRNARLYCGSEKRSEPRHFMAVPVIAVPVDEQFRAIGDPIALAARDISKKGIGLVHPQPIGHGLTAVQMHLAGEEVNVVVDILWSKPLGPFECSGGGFVAKLDGFPTALSGSSSLGTEGFSASPPNTDRLTSAY